RLVSGESHRGWPALVARPVPLDVGPEGRRELLAGDTLRVWPARRVLRTLVARTALVVLVAGLHQPLRRAYLVALPRRMRRGPAARNVTGARHLIRQNEPLREDRDPRHPALRLAPESRLRIFLARAGAGAAKPLDQPNEILGPRGLERDRLLRER